MSAVAVEIAPRPAKLFPVPSGLTTTPEPAGLVIVDDVELLTDGTTPGCGEDNPYQ